MSRKIVAVIALLIILAAIQFVQPPRNRNNEVSKTGIVSVVNVPADIQLILKSSCYDCHSDNTRYPWYAAIQPGAWWMASHIKEGKAELNFDQFGSYSKRRQLSKLKAIKGSIEDESMPLASYTFIHREADLSNTEQIRLKNWIETAGNEISK